MLSWRTIAVTHFGHKFDYVIFGWIGRLYDRMQLWDGGGNLPALDTANAFEASLLYLYGQIGAPKDLFPWKAGGQSIERLTDLSCMLRK